jgi:ribosome-binding factor A
MIRLSRCMNRRKASTRVLRWLRGQVDPDDGIDPRERSRGGPHRETGRKVRQLCGQAAEALNEVLAGQSGDDVLRSVYVVSVVPAPDAGRLLVTVAGLPGLSDHLDPCQVIERLQYASGRLRGAVAAAITRRRSPVLDYRFALSGLPGKA